MIYLFILMAIASLLMVLLSDYKGHSGLVTFFSANRWDHPLNWEAVISYIFMLGYDNTNVNGPTWSLVHEMRISLIFPLIMLMVIKFDWKKSLVVGTGVSLFFFAGVTIFHSMLSNEILREIAASFRDTFFYATLFIFGALFAKNLVVAKTVFEKLNKISKVLLFLLSLVLINIDEVFPFIEASFSNPYINQLAFMAIEWSVALGVIILFTFAIYSVRFSKFLNHSWFLWLGKVSYSLYLTHLVVLIVTMYTLGKIIPVYIALSLVPVFALVVAYITHKYVETPAQKIGNYLVLNKKKRLFFKPKESL